MWLWHTPNWAFAHSVEALSTNQPYLALMPATLERIFSRTPDPQDQGHRYALVKEGA